MILIVDDDYTARFLMTRTIKSVDKSQNIQTATNGEEALTFLNQTCSVDDYPDLVLLDINMPIMNGFEFLQELQNSSIDAYALKIAVLTSSSNPIDYLMAHEYPIIGYLEKPLTEDKLKSVMVA